MITLLIYATPDGYTFKSVGNTDPYLGSVIKEGELHFIIPDLICLQHKTVSDRLKAHGFTLNTIRYSQTYSSCKAEAVITRSRRPEAGLEVRWAH